MDTHGYPSARAGRISIICNYSISVSSSLVYFYFQFDLTSIRKLIFLSLRSPLLLHGISFPHPIASPFYPLFCRYDCSHFFLNQTQRPLMDFTIRHVEWLVIIHWNPSPYSFHLFLVFHPTVVASSSFSVLLRFPLIYERKATNRTSFFPSLKLLIPFLLHGAKL